MSRPERIFAWVLATTRGRKGLYNKDAFAYLLMIEQVALRCPPANANPVLGTVPLELSNGIAGLSCHEFGRT